MNVYLSMIIDALTSLGKKPSSCLDCSCTLFKEKKIYDPEILAIRPMSEGLGILTIREKPDGKVCCCCEHCGFFFSKGSLVEILDIVLSVYDSYQNWDTKLTEAVKSGADIQELTDIGSTLIHNPFFIADWGGHVLSYSKGYTPDMFTNASQHSLWENVLNSQLAVSVVEHLRQSPNLSKVISGQNPTIMTFKEYEYTCLIGNINNSGDINIYIHIMQFDQLLRQPTDCHIAKTFLSAINALPENKLPRCKNSIITLFSNLYEELEVSKDDLNWAFVTLGWNKEKYFLLLRIRSNDGKRLVMAAGGQFKKIPSTISFVRGDEVILFMRQCDLLGYEVQMKMLSKSLGLSIGVSLPFNDWHHILVQKAQAAVALDFASINTNLSFCQDHILDYLFQQLGQLGNLLQLCHPAVNYLHEYDIRNSTDLLKTLTTYLISERNAIQTADLLFVHRNTIQYRINRIKELTNIDLEDPDTRLYIMLSSRMSQ